jgi:uracil-DNA glycosylase family 4
MPAQGAKRPLVYILGEAPGAREDERGEQFVGDSGRLLRVCLPANEHEIIRWNNTTNCWPGKGNPTPEHTEIECCRPRVAGDIAKTKPKVVVGFGNVPLEWATGQRGIYTWRWRRIPVVIGGHTCWYVPMLHPAALIRLGEGSRKFIEEYGLFKFELQKLFNEVEDWPDAAVEPVEKAYDGITILDGTKPDAHLAKLEAFIQQCSEVGLAAMDLETNCIRPYHAKAKILSFAISTGDETVSVALDHKSTQWPQEHLKDVHKLFKQFLYNNKVQKIAHNSPFELEWCSYFYGKGVARVSVWHDTMAAAYILDYRKTRQGESGDGGASGQGFLDLESQVLAQFGINIKALGNLNRRKMAEEPLSRILPYNGLDAKWTYKLHMRRLEHINEQDMRGLYREQIRRIPTLVLSQLGGLPVSQEEVRAHQRKLDTLIAKTEKEIALLPSVRAFARKEGTFNPASAPQVITIFKDYIKAPQVKVGDNAYSADESILAQIKHPLARLILKHRVNSKLKSTYIDPAAPGGKYLWPDGLLHPQYNSMKVVTRRLSSSDPNAQNYPREERWIRSMIRPPEGHIMVMADYGQVEARVIGMASKDPVLCKSLWEDYDIHMEWAERVAHAYPNRIGGKQNLTDKDVMKKFRTDIKNQWTFPLFFGARVGSVAGYLQIPEYIIAPLVDDFWNEFAGVAEWQEVLVKQYDRDKFVTSLNGFVIRAPLERNKIINSPIQSTAGDFTIDSMNRLSEYAYDTGRKQFQACLNIHDDLSFFIPKKTFDRDVEIIIDHMVKLPFEYINVPISIEVSYGKDWANPKGLEPIDKFRSDTWKPTLFQSNTALAA